MNPGVYPHGKPRRAYLDSIIADRQLLEGKITVIVRVPLMPLCGVGRNNRDVRPRYNGVARVCYATSQRCRRALRREGSTSEANEHSNDQTQNDAFH